MSDIIKDARISLCQKYRFSLIRQTEYPVPRCKIINWIMLNPSTADSENDDATIRKCMKFSWSLGMQKMIVTNLFAYRTKDRHVMKDFKGDTVGIGNDVYIHVNAIESSIVVCAWGTDGPHQGRDKEVLTILSKAGIKPFCLHVTKNNHPGHPLYLKDSSELIQYFKQEELHDT